MKRAYEIKIERGENWQGAEYVVVAASDEEAVRKAKKQCADAHGVKTGWRCTSLREREAVLIA
jgi:hypothetical protein